VAGDVAGLADAPADAAGLAAPLELAAGLAAGLAAAPYEAAGAADTVTAGARECSGTDVDLGPRMPPWLRSPAYRNTTTKAPTTMATQIRETGSST
jgi:hypothetical protein